MWINLGFFTMGLFVGNLAGLSATSIVSQMIGLFFALAGGSIIAFLKKLETQEQKAAGQALFAASLGALLGVYVSVLVVQWHLLSPPGVRAPNSPSQISVVQGGEKPAYYLPASPMKDIVTNSNAIHIQYERGILTLEEAYEKTYDLIHGGLDQ